MMDFWRRIKKMSEHFLIGDIDLSDMIDKRYRMSAKEFERSKVTYRRKSNISANKISAKDIAISTTEKSEAFLYDVLDQVFGHLNAKDLSNAAKVSKSWRATVRRERLRRGPESVILKYAYDCEEGFDYVTKDEDEMRKILYHEKTSHISNFIRSKPEMSIFFTTDTSGVCKEPWYQIQGRFSGEFLYESSLVVIETLGVSVDETEAIGINNLTAGLFLPLTEMVKIKIVWPYLYEIENNHEKDNYAHGIVEELFTTENEHTCIIMFTECVYDYDIESEIFVSKFHSDVLSSLKKRRERGNYTLWGGGVASMTMTGSHGDDAVPWMGVSISGPSLRSWAIVLDCNLSKSDIEKKLLILKKDVHLRSEAVALMLVPSNRRITRPEKLARITMFKKIFPTLRLLTVFNDQEHPVFSFNSNCTNTDQKIHHIDAVSYLILSYGYPRPS